MKRVIFASTAVASMLVLAAPVAQAAEVPTGPDTAACSQAVVVEFQAATAAVDAADALDAASKVDLAADRQLIAAAEQRMKAAQDALKVPPATAEQLSEFDAATADLQRLLKQAQDRVPPSDLTKQLQTAQYLLQQKIEARVAACKPSGSVVTTTSAPPATTTVTPAPSTAVVIPEDTSTDGGQVSVVPNDAPETGEGPAPMPAAHRFALAALLVNFAGIAGLHFRRLVRR